MQRNKKNKNKKRKAKGDPKLKKKGIAAHKPIQDYFRAPTKEDKERIERKRKYEETKKEKESLTFKRNKLSDLAMGNLAYVTNNLTDQLKTKFRNKKTAENFATELQEKLIDLLQDNYRTFWKEHIQYILDRGIAEDAIKRYYRRGAVT